MSSTLCELTGKQVETGYRRSPWFILEKVSSESESIIHIVFFLDTLVQKAHTAIKQTGPNFGRKSLDYYKG
eukprot:snap_masked-scaffold_2-processed-gene-26.18-mRNA-1 protein AED:1.00 eAED:1.00 QI:0/0/0/0/1/1/2/0/70